MIEIPNDRVACIKQAKLDFNFVNTQTAKPWRAYGVPSDTLGHRAKGLIEPRKKAFWILVDCRTDAKMRNRLCNSMYLVKTQLLNGAVGRRGLKLQCDISVTGLWIWKRVLWMKIQGLHVCIMSRTHGRPIKNAIL